MENITAEFKTVETVYGFDGEKVGVTVREGCEWASYNTSDIEVYRGKDYLMAAYVLQGRD